MAFNRQSSQPENSNGFASRKEIRNAFRSAGAKYPREVRRPCHEMEDVTVEVTCHLCHFTFTHPVSGLTPVSSFSAMVCCPSCGVYFEFKPKNQADSTHLEQIAGELARLREEIESSISRKKDHREKTVLGPLPLQTLKKSFSPTGPAGDENPGQSASFYSMIGRVRSALVHLENEQLDDYLQWREGLRRHRFQGVEPTSTQRERVDVPLTQLQNLEKESPHSRHLYNSQAYLENAPRPVHPEVPRSFADYSESLRHRKSEFRYRIAVAGIVFCFLLCVTMLIVQFVHTGNSSQPVAHGVSNGARMLTPIEVIEVAHSPSRVATAENRALLSGATTLPFDNTASLTAIPDLTAASSATATEMITSLPSVSPAVDLEKDQERQQLLETQARLDQLALQYEQTRQTNEQLERVARQNEAESFLWQAYANMEKSPVRSMILSLQAIERFKELGLEIPNDARWTLNQSLAAQKLGISLNGFQGGIDAMTLSKDGQWLLFAGTDGAVWLWDIARHDQVEGSYKLDTINGGVSQLLLTSNVQYGFCVGRNGTIRIWDLKLRDPWERPIVISDGRCHFTNVSVSDDGNWLAAYGKLGRMDVNAAVAYDVYLWDLTQLARNGILPQPLVLKGHEKPIRSLAISNDSKWLVSGSEDRTVRVYDLKAAYPAAEQIVLKGHELAVHCVAISHDGRWLVTGGCDSILRIWDLQSRQSMAVPIELQEHEGWISSLTFSPDGRFLATGSYDNTIRLWRMAGGRHPEVTQVLNGHVSPIKSIEFSRQGNHLVSLGFDREVRLWNLDQGNPSENVLSFSNPDIPISNALLTGDGKWLILTQPKPNATTNSGLRLWPLHFDDAYTYATGFAEARFPTQYQQRPHNLTPILEQQESRIAMSGRYIPTGMQYPFEQELPAHESPYPTPGNDAIIAPSPSTQLPPPLINYSLPRR